MCKTPSIGSTLDEHNRIADERFKKERMRDYNERFKKLVPASEADLRDKVIELEEEVEQLKARLAAQEESKLQIQIDTLLNPTIYPSMKAGCIGEFTISVEHVCPECWNRDEEDDNVCELCNGESDESSLYEQEHGVPWTTQKEIFKMMCKYKALALKQEKLNE